MPEATCPKCGAYYRGWALLNPRYQTCLKCGASLEIKAPGQRVFKGYSPFAADELVIKPPTGSPRTPDKKKEKGKQKS